MRTVSFTVFGIAQAKGSSRAFTPKGWSRPIITSTNKSLKAWESAVRVVAQQHAGTFFDGPVRLELAFYLPRPKSLAKKVLHCTTRPDLDKQARAAIDPLTGVLFKDDAQVVELRASKQYAPEGKPACCVVTVADAAPPAAVALSLFEGIGRRE